MTIFAHLYSTTTIVSLIIKKFTHSQTHTLKYNTKLVFLQYKKHFHALMHMTNIFYKPCEIVQNKQ